MNKRGYYAWAVGNTNGIAVVAHTQAEARKIAFKTMDCVWIDLRCKWVRGADVEDFPIGCVEDPVAALRAGLYDHAEDCPCDGCGREDWLELYHGEALCPDCIYAAREAMI